LSSVWDAVVEEVINVVTAEEVVKVEGGGRRRVDSVRLRQ